MDQTAPERNARQKVMQTILDLGVKAFSAEVAEKVREQGKQEFDQFIEKQVINNEFKPSPC